MSLVIVLIVRCDYHLSVTTKLYGYRTERFTNGRTVGRSIELVA